MTYSKSSNRERDLFKIQQEREGLIQNPATQREDLLKIQQEREGLIQNPATEREDLLKIQQERDDLLKIQQQREGLITILLERNGIVLWCRGVVLIRVEKAVVTVIVAVISIKYEGFNVYVCGSTFFFCSFSF